MNEPHSCSEQIQKLRPKPGDLLVINLHAPPTKDQHARMVEAFSPLAETLGCRLILLEPGMSLSLHVDPATQHAEQQKQTALLEQIVEQQGQLIQALAEDQGDQDTDAQPTTYMDGSPCR